MMMMMMILQATSFVFLSWVNTSGPPTKATFIFYLFFIFLKLWRHRKQNDWKPKVGTCSPAVGRLVGRPAVGALQSFTWQESQCSASRRHIPGVSIHARVKLAARIQLRRELSRHGRGGGQVGRPVHQPRASAAVPQPVSNQPVETQQEIPSSACVVVLVVVLVVLWNTRIRNVSIKNLIDYINFVAIDIFKTFFLFNDVVYSCVPRTRYFLNNVRKSLNVTDKKSADNCFRCFFWPQWK